MISRRSTTTLKHSIASKLESVAGELLKLLNSKLMTLSESSRLAWGTMLGDIDAVFSVWRNHISASFKVVIVKQLDYSNETIIRPTVNRRAEESMPSSISELEGSLPLIYHHQASSTQSGINMI